MEQQAYMPTTIPLLKKMQTSSIAVTSEKLVLDTSIIEKFNPILSVCNLDHLEYCSCQNKLVDEIFLKNMDKEWEEMRVKGLDTNNAIIDSRIDFAKDKAKRDIALKCKLGNVRCPLELDEIKQNISFFTKKFNLDDPRVYMIVKAVLSHQLSVFRMQQQSNYRGVLQEMPTKDGSYWIMNPVEEEKRKFDDSIIKAVEVLNKIVNGENVNMNVNFVKTRDIIKTIPINATILKEGEQNEDDE